MKTTKFGPKDKLEVFAMDLRDRIAKTYFTAEVDILATGNVGVSNAKLNKADWHTGAYDERYGGNWYIDEMEVPGKKKGTTEIVPVARNYNLPDIESKIKRTRHMNYDDWGKLNQIINETADHHNVTFNLKTKTHIVRQGDNWGNW